MKIAVATKDWVTVSGHAGQARCWLLYDLAEHRPGQALPSPARVELTKEQLPHYFDDKGPHPPGRSRDRGGGQRRRRIHSPHAEARLRSLAHRGHRRGQRAGAHHRRRSLAGSAFRHHHQSLQFARSFFAPLKAFVELPSRTKLFARQSLLGSGPEGKRNAGRLNEASKFPLPRRAFRDFASPSWFLIGALAGRPQPANARQGGFGGVRGLGRPLSRQPRCRFFPDLCRLWRRCCRRLEPSPRPRPWPIGHRHSLHRPRALAYRCAPEPIASTTDRRPRQGS